METDRDIVHRTMLRACLTVAHQEYRCDECQGLIHSGDEYRLEVFAIHVRFRTNGRVQKMISTLRTHVHGCEPDDDPHEECLEREEWSENYDALPLAA